MKTIEKIVLASSNQGKLREFKHLLQGAQFEIIPQSKFNTPEAIEDGLSFVENSIIKARHAAEHSGLPALADDSGIEVDYLNGEPGIYSARYAGEDSSAQANIDKLLAAMEGVEAQYRTARFRCCIVFVRHPKDPSPLIADASWEGIILNKKSGTKGFGYDPVFYVPTHQCSSAELDPDEKSKISHRGLALKMMLSHLKSLTS